MSWASLLACWGAEPSHQFDFARVRSIYDIKPWRLRLPVIVAAATLTAHNLLAKDCLLADVPPCDNKERHFPLFPVSEAVRPEGVSLVRSHSAVA